MPLRLLISLPLLLSLFGGCNKPTVETNASNVARRVPDAPPFENWAYPDAMSLHRGKGGGAKEGDKVLSPTTFYSTWVTPDRFADVVVFYARKLGYAIPEQFAERKPSNGGSIQSKVDTAVGQTVLLHNLDNADPEEHLKLRPVRVECFACITDAYHVNLVVTRADGENHTHIIAVYTPMAELVRQIAP